MVVNNVQGQRFVQVFQVVGYLLGVYQGQARDQRAAQLILMVKRQHIFVQGNKIPHVSIKGRWQYGSGLGIKIPGAQHRSDRIKIGIGVRSNNVHSYSIPQENSAGNPRADQGGE